MKHYLLAVTMVVVALVFTACGSKESGNKSLVLYYSQTGATEKVALELQKSLGADIEAIELVEPYGHLCRNHRTGGQGTSGRYCARTETA